MAESTHLLGLPLKHKPGDIKPQGAGSGLDADKLDGLHASEIGGGGGADERVKVSATDTTTDYLQPKLVAGTGITITKQNPSGNENLKLEAGRKWYLADEGSWVGRYPHLIYGSWTRQNNGNAVLAPHGSWSQIYDACWLWNDTEKVFYIWYGGVYAGAQNIGHAKFDPATLQTTYLNNDNPVLSNARYPSVIKDGNTYYVAFMRGWDGIFSAYSSNGINWTETGNLTSTHWTPSWTRVGDASYLLGATIATPRTLGCFLGKGSTRYSSVVAYSGNPILQGGGTGSWDNYISNPAVYWCFGVFYIIYGGQTDVNQTWKSGIAVSPNGWKLEKYPWNLVLDIGAAGKFDESHVCMRSIVRIEDKFHCLYSGCNSSNVWALGYVTLE